MTISDQSHNNVYALLNPDRPGDFEYLGFKFKYQPYYIGMGASTDRRFAHLFVVTNHPEYDDYKSRFIRSIIQRHGFEKVLDLAVIIKNDLSREDAADLEYELTKAIGLKCKKQGPLLNSVLGGSTYFNKFYSHNPEESKNKNSASMIEFFHQNRNKNFDDLPKMKYRRIHCLDHGIQGGGRNGNSCYYYLLISPDGGYHLMGRGCLRLCKTLFGISHTTFEDSAKRNERRSDGKFARIMRGNGIGWYAFRFTKISECPVNITMGNQQPS